MDRQRQEDPRNAETVSCISDLQRTGSQQDMRTPECVAPRAAVVLVRGPCFMQQIWKLVVAVLGPADVVLVLAHVDHPHEALHDVQ